MGIQKSVLRETKDTTIFPYKDVKEFPSYFDGSGNREPLDEDWKKVGFIVPLPTLKIATELQRQSRTVRQGFDQATKAPFTYTETDLTKVAKYMTEGGFIHGWVGIDSEEGLGDAEYDQKWLLKIFNTFPFLFGKLFSEYMALIKQAEDEEVKADENFSDI